MNKETLNQLPVMFDCQVFIDMEKRIYILNMDVAELCLNLNKS